MLLPIAGNTNLTLSSFLWSSPVIILNIAGKHPAAGLICSSEMHLPSFPLGNVACLHSCASSANAGQAFSWRRMAEPAWMWMSARPRSRAASPASTPTVHTGVPAWMATGCRPTVQTAAGLFQVFLPHIRHPPHCHVPSCWLVSVGLIGAAG